jgi:uncharacterized membrane protein
MTVDRLRAAIALLALVGAGIAAYLVYTRYSGSAILCSTGSCETVQNSKYAEAAGIPVAVLGLVGYATIFLTASVPGPMSAALGVAFSATGFAFSAYLLYAQIVLIDAICQWCVANDAVVSLLTAACLWRFLREQPFASVAAG